MFQENVENAMKTKQLLMILQIKSIEKNTFFIFMQKFKNNNLSSNGASYLVPRGYLQQGQQTNSLFPIKDKGLRTTSGTNIQC